MVDSIDFGLEKKYNLAEEFVDSEELDENDADNLEDYFQLIISLA